MAKEKRRGLGRGLEALLANSAPDVIAPAETTGATSAAAPVPETAATDGPDRVIYIKPEEIEASPNQPRMVFDEEALGELAESIKHDGVQAPVIVRRVGDRYELVSGERRTRASIMAGLETIPAICRVVSDEDMLRLGLIENIQREDLNAIEQAKAFQTLIQELELTQEQLADAVGKKRATVTNTLRLLNLPDDVQQCVGDGAISMGHARALLAFDSPAEQSAACRKIINKGLSVREAEKLASKKPSVKSKPVAKDPNIASIEDELRRKIGTKVSLRMQSKGKGRIEIEYYSLDELDRILTLIRSVK